MHFNASGPKLDIIVKIFRTSQLFAFIAFSFFLFLIAFRFTANVYGGCLGDNSCSGSAPVYECCSSGQCGSGFSCSNHCCVYTGGGGSGSPPPPGSVKVCPSGCTGTYPNCTCIVPQPPPSGGGQPPPGCGPGCCVCNNNVCGGTCGGPGINNMYINFITTFGCVGGCIATNQPSCSNYKGWDYSWSVTATCVGSAPGLSCASSQPFAVSCTNSPCGGIVCGFIKDHTYDVTLKFIPPPNYVLPPTATWLTSGGQSGTGDTFNLSNVTGDGPVNLYGGILQYQCHPTKTVYKLSNTLDATIINNSNDPAWKTTSLTSTGSAIYMRTLITDVSGIPLPAADQTANIDIFENSVGIKGSIDGDNDIYKWKIPSTLLNGTYTMKSSYRGTSNQYWCPSTASVSLVVKRPPGPVCDSLNVNPVTRTGAAPLTVQYTVSAHENGAGSIVSNTVDLGGAGLGSTTVAPGATVTHTYPAGTYFPKATVTDSNGVTTIPSGACTQTVNVTSGCADLACPYYQDPLVNFAGCTQQGSCVAGNQNWSCPADSCRIKPFIQCGQVCVNNGYFQTTGGDVTALGNLDDRNLPSSVFPQPIQYVSMDGPNDAGIVAFNSFTSMVSSDRYSQQGASPGRNLDNYTYQKSSNLSYDRLLDNVLTNLGIVGGAKASDCSNSAPFTIYSYNGQAAYLRCYTPGNMQTALDTAINGSGVEPYQILIPGNPASASENINTKSFAVGNSKKVIVFANGSLSIKDINITSSQPTSGIVFVLNGDLSVTSATQFLDGVYIFPGQFSDGSGVTPLSVTGSLVGTGDDPFPTLKMGRTPANAPGEVFNFSGKYLSIFNGIISRPKISWTELPSK